MIEERRSPVVWVCVGAVSAVLLITATYGVATAGERRGVDPFVQNQKLGRGVNIIGYDPIWNSREKARFKAGYFRIQGCRLQQRADQFASVPPHETG